MSVFIVTQIGIAATGLVAIILVCSERPLWRKWAPVFGLVGQPFWFISTWTAGQYLTFALSLAYTATWAHSFYRQWVRQS